ncbi:MAG: DUF4421 family protein [Bacteroidaceae bacterium]|nr:DUF4421 family protein [Bacteroidaceae bacterium]
MMKRLILIFLLLTSLFQPEVSGRDRFKEFCLKADTFLIKRYFKITYDTNYIYRPPTKWAVLARYNLSGATIDSRGDKEDLVGRIHASAAYKSTISFTASYLGNDLSITFNPGGLIGWYKDYEFNLNQYYNRMGVDFIYQKANDFKGWTQQGDEEKKHFSEHRISMRTVNVNFYYAFNYRRFSYPAAFCVAYTQKRSAGSFMLGGSFLWQRLHIWEDSNLDIEDTKLKVANVAVGAGYGYNFVLPKQWLIHVSGLPAIIIYSHAHRWSNEEERIMKYHFPEFIVTGRAAITHTFGRYFVGATAVYNFTNLGKSEHLEIRHSKWRVRTFIGFKF